MAVDPADQLVLSEGSTTIFLFQTCARIEMSSLSKNRLDCELAAPFDQIPRTFDDVKR